MHRNSSGPNGAWLRRVTYPWNEMTITWNNSPSTTIHNQVAVNPSTSSTQDYLNIDVTALFQDIHENTNYGFQFMLQNENYYRTLNFFSSDAVDSTKRPTVVIHYSPKTTTSASITIRPGSNIGKDALVNGLSSRRNLNYGSEQQMPAFAGTSSGTPFLARSYMQFDLSGIPSGMKIDSSFLSLYAADQSMGLGAHRNSSGPNGAWLRKVTSTWNESTITWNNQPTAITTNQVALAPSLYQTQDYTDINVTSLIQDIFQSPINNGLQMILQNENFYRTLNFYSSDFADSLKWPKLVVYYSPISTSIDDVKANNSEFIVFPNPTNGVFHIEFNNQSNLNLSIIDLAGKEVASISNYKNLEQIDLSKCADGIYFIRATNGSYTATKKLIIRN